MLLLSLTNKAKWPRSPVLYSIARIVDSEGCSRKWYLPPWKIQMQIIDPKSSLLFRWERWKRFVIYQLGHSRLSIKPIMIYSVRRYIINVLNKHTQTYRIQRIQTVLRSRPRLPTRGRSLIAKRKDGAELVLVCCTLEQAGMANVSLATQLIVLCGPLGMVTIVCPSPS